MKNSKNTFWFPKKKCGIGWGMPNTWQGWIVLIIYLILVGIPSVFLEQWFSSLSVYLAYIGALTLIFIVIVWKKGEKIGEKGFHCEK